VSFRLGILGGGLQGLEAAVLARFAGVETVLVDRNPKAPASLIANQFIHLEAEKPEELDAAFGDCDLTLPANENLRTLRLLDEWSKRGRKGKNIPLAFDMDSYLITRDKLKSKELFARAGVPTPLPFPLASFPLIAKPNDKSGSQGVRLINGTEELSSLLNKEKFKGVMEEYHAGPSYSLEVIGTPEAYETFEITYLLMDLKYDCRGVVSPAKIPEDLAHSFREKTLTLAKALNLKGIMDAEIIDSPKGPVFLEIDARIPSQTPLAVWLSSGVNLLSSLIKAFVKEHCPYASLAASVNALGESLDLEPGHAILEHLSVLDGKISLTGEHRIAEARPLVFTKDFFGDYAALTDRRGKNEPFCATVMLRASSEEKLREARAELYLNLGKSLGGAALPPELSAA
jgi:pyrrolysine biosynthesis protein PylC